MEHDNPYAGGFGLISGQLAIDDLGSEPPVTYFGTQVNIIGELLQLRYDRQYITYVTTNLDSNSLKKFYGKRVYSRMKEMFNDLTMEGDDRRF